MITCGDKPKEDLIREQDYIKVSEISSMEGSGVSSAMEAAHKEVMLNLKETELRLGLPGCVSPDRTELCLLGPSKTEEEKSQMFVSPFKGLASGSKRGFLDTVSLGGDLTMSTKPVIQDAFTTNCGMNTKSHPNGCVDHYHTSFNSPRANNSIGKSLAANSPRASKEVTGKERMHQPKATGDDSLAAPVSKAQVVGWPPIRSYMKNTMATNPTKSNGEASVKPGTQCLYVKVSMDGAPYLRKIDLRNYRTYQELSTALEKMFSCFTLGQCSSHSGPEVDELSESRVVDLLHGAECVLTYEDKDGDWMLVGDVPWEMFTVSCRRLRIMKGSEAIGLGPRALEKCKD